MANSRSKPRFKVTNPERQELETLSRSRSAPAGYVERARMMLMHLDGVSISEIAQTFNTDRSKVYRCLDKAKEFGALNALDDLQRPGKTSKITPEAKAWIVSLACQKPVELGYPHEVWTVQLLVDHVRSHCKRAGHQPLSRISKSTVHGILENAEIKPHKVEYYLEKRDPDFDAKLQDVLYIYQQVELLKEKGAADSEPAITILSYDEKPGIQAIGLTAPDLPPVPGKHKTIGRDHEYVRHGTLSLLAGIDLLSGHVHGLVADRHRSCEFVDFLKLVDGFYPKKTKLRIILDNHSAHISKETNEFLASRPGRFEFTFTPKHASWLNIIEVFFSKMTRSFLRHIRVKSKNELTERLIQYLNQLNEAPVTFEWKYGLNDSLR